MCVARYIKPFKSDIIE